MASITASNPPTVRAPSGYSHGIVVAGRHALADHFRPGRHGPRRHLSATGEGQIAQAFANLRVVLEANGMGTPTW